MFKPEGYVLEEWEIMVKQAKAYMHSDCPLIEDEVIVLIDRYIKLLEGQVFNQQGI